MAANKKTDKAKAEPVANRKIPIGEKTVKKNVAADKAKGSNVKKASTQKRSSKQQKPGFFKRIGLYIKGTFTELKKVNWLSGEELAKSTGVVAGIVLIFTVVIWLMDLGLGALAAWLVG